MSTRVAAKQWASRVAQWKRSGQTAAQFGASHGIDPRQLTWWKWNLRKRAADAASAVAEQQQPRSVRFLPVRVRPAPSEVAAFTGLAAEVLLPGELVVRVGGGADPRWAAELIRYLAGRDGEPC